MTKALALEGSPSLQTKLLEIALAIATWSSTSTTDLPTTCTYLIILSSKCVSSHPVPHLWISSYMYNMAPLTNRILKVVPKLSLAVFSCLLQMNTYVAPIPNTKICRPSNWVNLYKPSFTIPEGSPVTNEYRLWEFHQPDTHSTATQ
jgi:hypothetical protein